MQNNTGKYHTQSLHGPRKKKKRERKKPRHVHSILRFFIEHMKSNRASFVRQLALSFILLVWDGYGCSSCVLRLLVSVHEQCFSGVFLTMSWPWVHGHMDNQRLKLTYRITCDIFVHPVSRYTNLISFCKLPVYPIQHQSPPSPLPPLHSHPRKRWWRRPVSTCMISSLKQVHEYYFFWQL